MSGLKDRLLSVNFRELTFLTDNIPEIGVFFDQDVSLPLIARKAPFVIDRHGIHELITQWDVACEQLELTHEELEIERMRADRLARQLELGTKSRWLRLGRKLGLGPQFALESNSPNNAPQTH